MANRIIPLPVDWPGRQLPVMPDDFSHYAPDGMGLGVAPVMRPGDTLQTALAAPTYYGFRERVPDPVRGAPLTDPRGGVIYFCYDVDLEKLASTLELIGMHLRETSYVVFAGSADNPMRDGYADQARIINRASLQSLYRPGPELSNVPASEIPLGDYVRQFIGEQIDKWHGKGATFSRPMYGMFGGDGDWAKEQLAFGCMVENAELGIYRIWSRAWLVTK